MSNFLITNGEVNDEENALENSDIEVKVTKSQWMIDNLVFQGVVVPDPDGESLQGMDPTLGGYDGGAGSLIRMPPDR